jgi:hypothetical protein
MAANPSTKGGRLFRAQRPSEGQVLRDDHGGRNHRDNLLDGMSFRGLCSLLIALSPWHRATYLRMISREVTFCSLLRRWEPFAAQPISSAEQATAISSEWWESCSMGPGRDVIVQ